MARWQKRHIQLVFLLKKSKQTVILDSDTTMAIHIIHAGLVGVCQDKIQGDSRTIQGPHIKFSRSDRGQINTPICRLNAILF